MNEQNNTNLVQRAYSCFKAGDIKSLLDLMANDIQWELPKIENVPFTGSRRGINSVNEFFTTLAQAQDVIEFSPKEFIAQGNKVIALGYYKWRAKESGLQFDSEFAHVFTVENNKVVAFHEYMDTAAFAAAYSKELEHH